MTEEGAETTAELTVTLKACGGSRLLQPLVPAALRAS